jgi:hypothetical protein
MAEIVEWLSPVADAISVRDGWPARRTAAITMARLRRRRSSWRMPTDIVDASSEIAAFRRTATRLRFARQKQPPGRLAKHLFAVAAMLPPAPP